MLEGEGGGGIVGEVGVDVYANVDRLEQDLNKARRSSQAFERDVNRGMKKTATQTKAAETTVKDLEKSTEELARAYSPLHAAQIRYIKDMEKIQRLQKAGVFNSNEAKMFADKAKAALRDAEIVNSRAGRIGMAAREQINRWSSVIIAAAGVAAVAVVRNSLNQIKAIKETSDALRISQRDWQTYKFAASQTGAELGQVERGFERLNVATARASTGARREADLFAALGISLKDANGEVKNAAQLMPELADALQRVGDKNQRAAAMQILFGESASEMDKLLRGGSDRINELAEAAENLGVVLSDEQIQRADETAAKLEQVKTVLSAQVAGVVADNADAIVDLANALGTLTTSILQFLDSNPELAFGLLGAVVGGKIGGLPGAVIGGTAGLLGAQAYTNRPELEYRRRQLEKARAADKAAGGTSARAFFELQDQEKRYQRALKDAGLTEEQYDRQRALSAQNNAPRTGGSGPNIDLGGLNLSGGSRRGGGRSGRGAAARAERERIRALRDDARFANELARFNADILRLAAAQAGTAEERAAIDLQLLDIERDRFERQMELEGPEGTGRYEAAEVELMREKFNAVDAAKRQAVELEKQERLLNERTEALQTDIQISMELASLDAELATTRKGRLSAEEELLELQFELERLKLQETIASGLSTAAEKAIAQKKLDVLGLYEELQRDLLRQRNQSPVESFFDSIEKSAAEIEDTLERVRAGKLQDRVDRSVGMADDISGSIANAGRMALALENPLEILRTLIFDLTEIFNEEVLIRPLQEWARQNIGGPLAERVTGAPAGPEGLYVKQLGDESLKTAIQLDQLRLAAARATQGFGVQIPANDALTAGANEAAGALDPLSASAMQVGGAFQQIIAMASGAGGGGGGILGALFSIGASALTGGASPNAALVPDVNATMAANAGIFHSGGMIGPDGRPVRRRLRHDERNITAQVGERVMRKDIAQRFGPALDMIDSGRLPMDLGIATMAAQRFMGTQDNRSFQFGDINVNGARSEREARRTAKQVSGEVQRGISRAAKQGVLKQ